MKSKKLPGDLQKAYKKNCSGPIRNKIYALVPTENKDSARGNAPNSRSTENLAEFLKYINVLSPICFYQGGGIHGEAHRAENETISG